MDMTITASLVAAATIPLAAAAVLARPGSRTLRVLTRALIAMVIAALAVTATLLIRDHIPTAAALLLGAIYVIVFGAASLNGRHLHHHLTSAARGPIRPPAARTDMIIGNLD